MALASAAPANAVPEVLRNSRRVVRFESDWLVEFIGRWMFAFERFELFIAVGPIIPSEPTLGKTVPSIHGKRNPDQEREGALFRLFAVLGRVRGSLINTQL